MTWNESSDSEDKSAEAKKRFEKYERVDGANVFDSEIANDVLSQTYFILRTVVKPEQYEKECRLVAEVIYQMLKTFRADKLEDCPATLREKIILITQTESTVYRAIRHIKKDEIIKFHPNTYKGKSKEEQVARGTFGNSVVL